MDVLHWLIDERHINQDRPMPIAEVLWHCAALNSAEHCVLSETETGWQIHGLTATPINDAPAHIEFDIDTDRDWLTRNARVQFHGREPTPSTSDPMTGRGP